VCKVNAALVTAELATRLRRHAQGDSAPGWFGPVDDNTTKMLLRAAQRAGADIIQAPQIVATPLQVAHLMVGKRVPYVRDIVAATVDGQQRAQAVNDVLFDGFRAEVVCGPLAKNRIGVQFRIAVQKLGQPIAEQVVRLPDSELSGVVQLPRTIDSSTSWSAQLATGGTTVVATPQNDGTWVMAILTVHTIRAPQDVARAVREALKARRR
jgi:hypothetical protein